MASGLKRIALIGAIAALSILSVAAVPEAHATPTHVRVLASASATKNCRSIPRVVRDSRTMPSRNVKQARRFIFCLWITAERFPAALFNDPFGSCSTVGAFFLSQFPDVVSDFNCEPDGSGGYILQLLICFNGGVPSRAEFWVNENSQAVIEVTHSQTNNGAAVDQFGFNGSATQWWVRLSDPDGNTLVVNTNTGKCLGVSAASKAWRAPLVQWDCNGSLDQEWRWQATGAFHGNNPIYNIINVNSGNCIDVPNSSTNWGIQLQQFGCNGTSAQHWH